jgi:hypothetical protein
MGAPEITIGLSSHRLETLPAAEKQMGRHRAVALEEPPTPGFEDMLAGRLDVADYVAGGAFEFPALATALCAILRRLVRAGVEIFQVAPYFEEMFRIHGLFEAGGRPEDIEPGTTSHEVYLAERAWTAALLDYYASTASSDLELVVPAVLEFTRRDGSRGRLRDRLRAAALADLAIRTGSLYVEAGYLHLGLLRELRRRLPGATVRPVWLLGEVIRPLTGRRQLLGPGDLLTLRATLRPSPDDAEARLLAARSLIHASLSIKDELIESDRSFPHTRHEVEVLQLVNRLDWVDCTVLFPATRSKDPIEARRVFEDHLRNTVRPGSRPQRDP